MLLAALPFVLAVPSVLALVLGMWVFKLPAWVSLLGLKFVFWTIPSWGRIDLDTIGDFAAPLGAAQLVFLLVAFAVPRGKSWVRIVVALPLFIGFLGFSSVAFLRLEDFAQTVPLTPAPASSAPSLSEENDKCAQELQVPIPDSPSARHEAALTRARHAVMSLAYSAQSGAKAWQPEVAELKRACDSLSTSDTTRSVMLGALAMSPNDDVSGILLEALGMKLSTFELDPDFHVFGTADTYSALWVLLCLGAGLLMQAGRAGLWEWLGVVTGLNGDAAFRELDEEFAGWKNLFKTVVSALACAAFGLHVVPAFGRALASAFGWCTAPAALQGLYSPTLVASVAPAGFTLGMASISILTTAAIADTIDIFTTVGFIAFHKDPRRTLRDGLVINLLTIALLQFVFYKHWSATLVSLGATSLVQGAIARAIPSGIVRRFDRLSALVLKFWRSWYLARFQTFIATSAAWSGLALLCVVGLSNPERSEAALDRRRAATGKPFSFELVASPGKQPDVSRLVNGSAYVTRVTVTSGQLDLYYAGGMSTCDGFGLRGWSGSLGKFSAPFHQELATPGLLVPYGAALCARLDSSTVTRATVIGYEFNHELH